MMTPLEQEILDKLRQLDQTGQQQVLNFVRQLPTPRGVDGASLLKYFGRIPADDLAKMEEAIAMSPQEWTAFINETYGSLADDPIECE